MRSDIQLQMFQSLLFLRRAMKELMKVVTYPLVVFPQLALLLCDGLLLMVAHWKAMFTHHQTANYLLFLLLLLTRKSMSVPCRIMLAVVPHLFE